MKLTIKSSVYLGLMVIIGLTSCKKENISTVNNLPEIPVTVTNQYDIFTAPTVKTSLSAGGAIQIILSIPATSGRTIKEITRVAAATAYGSVQVTTGLYNTAPIAGNGTTVTFNTTLAEYTAKTGLAAPTAAVSGTTTAAILARSFYFLITLDNGQTIVPTYVRVYVDK
ncbi:hypothetical protein [Pedobacter suwonensis]|uniref:hypothetical protein n=1 Tax=Pedobacter suwonensis TaxID=332999 RepID=UPI0025CBBAC4|nr:hypothetical protein [uncultured Pedobacter sp.]